MCCHLMLVKVKTSSEMDPWKVARQVIQLEEAASRSVTVLAYELESDLPATRPPPPALKQHIKKKLQVNSLIWLQQRETGSIKTIAAKETLVHLLADDIDKT